MFNGREPTRDFIRDCHVLMERTGMTRDKLFIITFLMHLILPLIAMFLFVSQPIFRPLIVCTLAIIVLVQIWGRTCPVAKIEWTLIPGAEKVTWTGAEALKHVTVVDSRIKFWYMIFTTTFGFVFLYLITVFFPDGVVFGWIDENASTPK